MKTLFATIRFALSLACAAQFAFAMDEEKTPPPPPEEIRAIAPDGMLPNARYLVYAEGRDAGSNRFKPLDPDFMTVNVSGGARWIEDPAGTPVNPITIETTSDATGEIVVDIEYVGVRGRTVLTRRDVGAAGRFDATIDVDKTTHAFHGLGAGVMFYDNQFGISKTGDIYDWCFKDVRTAFLHVLIRPRYEPRNDNDDWRTQKWDAFDFTSLERPFRIIREAKTRNPEIKIYATLYSPPAWMKANDSTAGDAGLKQGIAFRRELAEYVYAYLCHAKEEEIAVDYLGFFNEPDWPHSQDGLHIGDLGELAETFRDCADALETLIDASDELDSAPTYVFPDALGPGSITRSGARSEALKEKMPMLDRVGAWAVHDYWNTSGDYWENRYRELRAFPGIGDRPIWMSEWAQRYPRGDLASGLEYGTKILNALRLGAESWMVFEWMHPCGNQAGLISTDWGEFKPGWRYWRSKGYHVFRQVANTSPIGSRVVQMEGEWSGEHGVGGQGVEYLAMTYGDRIIVHLVNTEPSATPFSLELTDDVTLEETWLTTPTEDMLEMDGQTVRTKGDRLSGEIPAYSLITLELSR